MNADPMVDEHDSDIFEDDNENAASTAAPATVVPRDDENAADGDEDIASSPTMMTNCLRTTMTA